MPKRRVIVLLERIYNTILIVLTSAMFVTVAYNVFMRFVVNRSVGWADELSRFIFVWISFLGAVWAFQADEHVGLDLFVHRIPSPRLRRGVAVMRRALVLVVLFFLTGFGYPAAASARNVSPALSIPMKTVYMIVPFCGLLMCLLGIGKLGIAMAGNEDFDTARQSSVE